MSHPDIFPWKDKTGEEDTTTNPPPPPTNNELTESPGLSYKSTGAPACAETLLEINTLIMECGISTTKSNEMLIKYEGNEDQLLINLRNLRGLSAPPLSGPGENGTNDVNVDNKVYDDKSTSGGQPPRAVFNTLGVMELERRTVGSGGATDNTNTTQPTHTIDGEDDDDLELAEENDRGSLYPSSSFDGVSGKFENAPTFDKKGKFIGHESRSTTNTGHGSSTDNGLTRPIYDQPVRSKRVMKYWMGAAVLLAVVVCLTIFLVVPGEHTNSNQDKSNYGEGTDDGVNGAEPTAPNVSPTSKFHNMGNPTPTEQQLAAPSMPSRINPPGSHQFTVLKYGYNYVQDVSGGWISWPKQYDATTFLYYNKTTGVVDLGTCAQKCSEEDAPTGAWSIKYQACWCNFLTTDQLCKEPCVKEEYIDFSTVPFSNFDYCEMSVCDKDWHHSKSYCEDDIKFDGEECDATIDALLYTTGGSLDVYDDEVYDDDDAQDDYDDEEVYVNPEELKSLSDYGYPYAQDVSTGWISWPPVYDIDSFETFKEADGVTTLAECAKKCQDTNAATGAWSVKYSACWCNFVEPVGLCKEPCVKERYIDFSKMPFTAFNYCDKSVCDKDWYHSEWYCDVDVKFDKDVCDSTIKALTGGSSADTAVSGTPLDLTAYNYVYSQTVSVGWISWPKLEEADTFKSFTSDSDNVNSVQDCAAKCDELDAPTGAWSTKYQACWCNFVDTPKLCKEPCVEEEYDEFSTVPFDMEYCDESVCDKDWHHSNSYCDDDVKFNPDACEQTIKILELHDQAGKRVEDLYTYTQIQKGGWLSWPKDESDETFKSFTADADGVNNVDDCAVKCDELDAPTGAWSTKYNACWCSFVEKEKLCKEPCVEEEYDEFSNWPFTDFDYCTESVCDKDWHHSQSYCEDTIQFNVDICDATIKSLTTSSVSATEYKAKIADYYKFSQGVKGGWIAWPKDETENNFQSFDSDDGITSAVECAKKCEELGASTGAWSVNYEACYCNFVDTVKVCKEPCVDEEYIDFSTVPFTTFDYCEESVCAKDWHHSQEYCDDTVKFDADECAATIEKLMPPAKKVEDIYTYSQTAMGGWLSWPKDKNDSTFRSFTADDGVTNVDECAAMCDKLGTSTGAWSTKYSACWCSFVEVSKLCKEPCVEEEYTEFSNVAFTTFDYCSESVCAKDWHHSQEYCNDEIKFDAAVCAATIQDLTTSSLSSKPIKEALTDYYAYTQDVKGGWLSWPQETNTDNFQSFKSTDGVTNPLECAAKCHELDAPTGGWSVTYQACFCNFVDTIKLCKEPCVDEEYIDFSNVPFTTFDYCTESVCAKDWHHSQEYCDDTVKFNANDCAATISALTKGAPSAPGTLDLSEYDYPYAQTISKGWLSWPKDESESTFQSFTSDDDNVNSVQDCAAKCNDLNAATGSWSTKYSACWCNFVDGEKLCKEPCVEEEYEEFGVMPFDDIDYCDESICDKDWHHSQSYCDDDVKFAADACAATIASLTGTVTQPTESTTVTTSAATVTSIPDVAEISDVDLTAYGFRHVQHARSNWLVWQVDVYDDQVFQAFDEDDDVSSVEECAQKCQELEAHAGAWRVKYETCWCDLGDGVTNLCKEPCVEEEYIDFSTVPFSDFVFCDKSVCDSGEARDNEFCEKDVNANFDNESCNEQIAAIMASTTTTTSATPPQTEENQLILLPAAMTSTKQFLPDSTTGGKVHLTVQGGGERFSYIRFDLPDFADNEKVVDAKLTLYLTSHHTEGEEDNFSVTVEELPWGGKWEDDTISWNNPISETGKTLITNFEATKLLDDDVRKQKYEVPVLLAVKDDITFKLSMEKEGRLDWAGRTWSEGDSKPYLMLTVEKSG